MPLALQTLDDYVEAFETARRQGEAIDLRAFLPPDEDPLYQVVLRELVRVDLEFGWESNRARSLEDYRRDFPELFVDPASVQEIAFEEFRLRRRAGQTPSPKEYASRYGVCTDNWPGATTANDPFLASVQVEAAARSYRDFRQEGTDPGSLRLDDWQPPTSVVGIAGLFRELHRTDPDDAIDLAEGLIRMPEAGSEFLGFELLHELGRGAFGRVFLARQAALADRLVALKVAPDIGSESQTLAQLQHTHIAPIYSVHHAGPLQAVCMPYCGNVTLTDVLKDRGTPRTGLDLLGVLSRKQRPEDVPTPAGPTPGVATELRGHSYSEAVLWLGARLADGLAHAHERGVIHRDVKPANVLLTDEGLPVLLDFNVAQDVKQRGAGAAMVGGTLPYMAPETLEAMRGTGCPASDGRVDVYALGIVLFELLVGKFPFAPVRAGPGWDGEPKGLDQVLVGMLTERLQGPPCPRQLDRTIPPATAAIIRHCLEPDPARRYPSARALQEDIERQLAHQPLRHAPEPWSRERLAKFVRRHPRLGPALCVAAASLLLVVALFTGWQVTRLRQAEQARQTWVDFQVDNRLAHFLLGTRPENAEQREQGEQAAAGALGRYAVLDDPLWQQRPTLTALPGGRTDAVRAAVGELLLVLARSRVEIDPGTAGQTVVTDVYREALGYNERAEACFPKGEVPPTLWSQRVWLCERLGRPDEANQARQASRERQRPEPESARDRVLAAREWAAQGRFAAAAALLEPIVQQEPDHYWAWFLLGLCRDGLGQDGPAVTCYTACVALVPDFHGPYMNRGQANLRLRRFAAARADFDRAIALAPQHPDAYLDRALARRGLGQLSGAIIDLTAALERGCAATRVYFLRARIRAQAGDRAGAERDRVEGLHLKPADELSWVARALARLPDDPTGALADLEQALKLNPASRSALMNKAHVLAEHRGQQAGAARVLDRLLALYPDHVRALAGQAVVLARLGQRQRAHERIAAALERQPGGEVRYQAACVYALTSPQVKADADDAIAHLRRAIDDRFGLELLERDADLAALHGREDFQRLVRAAALLDEWKNRER